jgi:hypothetical protein
VELGGIAAYLRRTYRPLFDQGVFLANPGSLWMRGTSGNTVSLGAAGELVGPEVQAARMTLDNTRRLRACLAFDLSRELPAPAWPLVLV